MGGDFEYNDSGHRFNLDLLRLELYRLMSYVLARRVIEDDAAKHPPLGQDPIAELMPRTPLESLERDYFLDEAGRLLLFTAIAMRTLDDRCPGVFDYYLEAWCGVVREARHGTKRLSLRDACNKIVHAKYVLFDLKTAMSAWNTLTGLDEIPFEPIDSKAAVVLSGESRAGEWGGLLDLYRYTDLVVKSVNFHRHQEKMALDR